jgi:hypothetical protein
MRHLTKIPAVFALALALSACGENQTFVDRDAYVPGEPPPLSCVPNLDGQIDAVELPVALGVPIDYLVNPAGTEVSIDIAGSVNSAGQRVWDFSADDGTDQLAVLAAVDVSERWYADAFPGAEFAAPLDAGGRTEGIYVRGESALFILGLASREPDPPEGSTLIVYTEPVAFYRFPIAPGMEHVSVGEVMNGELRGLPYAGRDVYEVRADAVGIVELPDLTFEQAHRVRTRVTVQPAAGMATSQTTVSFLFECFGEIARATSLPNETTEDFTTASETRRLALE